MFYLACKLAGITFGFLFPAYSSYKAIRINDAQAIETWLMYWVVMSAVHAVETTAEWAVNWLPFYYEIKAMLVIWLSLPQIQGSTFVYVSYIHPFLLEHEQEIDDTLAQAKTKVRAAGLDYAKRVWLAVRDTVVGAVAASGGDAQAANAPTEGSAALQEPSTDQSTPHKSSQLNKSASAFDPLASPALGAWNFANTALKTYGPAAIAAGHALFRPVQASGASPQALRKKNDDYAALGRGNAPRRPATHPEEDDRVEPLQARSTGHSRSASRQAEDSRLYQQEVSRHTGPSRRTASASAVMGATTAYTTYSREQLRQRRLQLEAELAALESPTTLLSPGDKPSRTPSPGSDTPIDSSSRLPSSSSMPLQPLRTRERHVSGPASAGVRAGRISPMTASYASPLEGSMFETIAREDADDTLLPPDWGRRAEKSGWKGAPPSVQQQHQRQRTASQSALATSNGPSTSTPQARQSWFWSSASQPHHVPTTFD